ncbi:MAG: hypothetical protein R3B40_14825 [Polyangiales bacterium]
MTDLPEALTWVVTQDDSGELGLFVFAADSDVVLFGRWGYERAPGDLRRDVACLRAGVLPDAGEADAQARWDGLVPYTEGQPGFWVVANHDEVVPAEAMSAAAWAELKH